MTTDKNTSNQSCAFTRQLRSRLCATMGSNCKKLSKFGSKWNNHTVVPTVDIIRQVSVVKMRRGVLLVTVFLLMKLRCSQSRCEEPGSRISNSDVGVFERTNPNDCHSVRQLQRNICLLFFFFTFPADCWFGRSEAEHFKAVQRSGLWQLRGFDGQTKCRWDSLFPVLLSRLRHFFSPSKMFSWVCLIKSSINLFLLRKVSFFSLMSLFGSARCRCCAVTAKK